MSRIFQTRTLKICQNAPEKNLSHSFPHTRKIFLPPPPLITHARVESHPSPPPPVLGFKAYRVVTRGSRAKSHTSRFCPFPPSPPPHSLLEWATLLDDPPPSPLLSRMYGRTLSLDSAARNPEIRPRITVEKVVERGEKRRGEELTRRIERVFKPPYTRGVGRRLARLGGGKSKSERIKRGVDFRPADVVHPPPLSLPNARKCQLADIKSSLDQRVWDDD